MKQTSRCKYQKTKKIKKMIIKKKFFFFVYQKYLFTSFWQEKT